MPRIINGIPANENPTFLQDLPQKTIIANPPIKKLNNCIPSETQHSRYISEKQEDIIVIDR